MLMVYFWFCPTDAALTSYATSMQNQETLLFVCSFLLLWFCFLCFFFGGFLALTGHHRLFALIAEQKWLHLILCSTSSIIKYTRNPPDITRTPFKHALRFTKTFILPAVISFSPTSMSLSENGVEPYLFFFQKCLLLFLVTRLRGWYRSASLRLGTGISRPVSPTCFTKFLVAAANIAKAHDSTLWIKATQVLLDFLQRLMVSICAACLLPEDRMRAEERKGERGRECAMGAQAQVINNVQAKKGDKPVLSTGLCSALSRLVCFRLRQSV